ncbi:MAG TPA: hypothetical protein VME20_05430, partial [Acidimicrobiales bacterium]|nr:hypothetical protein [Acidimicrobiales bacterium]
MVVVAVSAATVWLYLACLAHLAPAGHERAELWPVIAGGMWATSLNVVRVRNRKMSFWIAVTEIPVLVSIVFLSPLQSLTAIGAGCAGASIQQRRRPAKTALNVAAYWFAVSVGIDQYDHMLGKASPVHGWGLLVSGAAVATIAATDLALLMVGFAFADRRGRRPPLVPVLIQLGVYIAVCTSGGLIAISLVFLNTWSIVLFIAIAVAASLAYRATVQSSQRYANLEKLYGFTKGLGGLTEGHDVIGTALEQSRTLLSAGRAELVA